MLVDFRCKNCGRLLAKEHIITGKFEIKCNRCGTFNTFEADISSRNVDSFSKR